MPGAGASRTPACERNDQEIRMRLMRWLAGFALAIPLSLHAQAFPGDKPVRIVVPFTAGSASDTVARVVADELRKTLGGTYVIDNKPGASGQIGSEQVAKSPADGHTLLLTTSATHSARPWLVKTYPFDPVKDFVHIARVISVPFLLVVHPDLPVRNVQEFIAHARKHPGLAYGYGSATSQVAAATFASLAKIEALSVPYKSQPPAVVDLMEGRIQFMMADPSIAAEQIKAGKLRAIAITAHKRSLQMPDVPTLAESGMGEFDPEVWLGIGAPAGTPRDVAETLNAEILKMGQRDEVRQRFSQVGLDLAPNSLGDHAAFVSAQLAAWGKRIKAAGIQPE
ncbi:tripartite tricarboxylate transporter substrate binding protein [Reyranella sp. CPCC 100927]|nr:tripartite tricarboxylate transporter substrate binding protein [Reyranella sp. CPCC 100927]